MKIILLAKIEKKKRAKNSQHVGCQTDVLPKAKIKEEK